MNSNRDLLQGLFILVISLVIGNAVMTFKLHKLGAEINKNTNLIQCLTEGKPLAETGESE